jgi:hypothetical protein
MKKGTAVIDGNLQNICNEATVAYFKVVSLYSQQESDECHARPYLRRDSNLALPFPLTKLGPSSLQSGYLFQLNTK